jgi:hypothetical protein
VQCAVLFLTEQFIFVEIKCYSYTGQRKRVKTTQKILFSTDKIIKKVRRRLESNYLYTRPHAYETFQTLSYFQIRSAAVSGHWVFIVQETFSSWRNYEGNKSLKIPTDDRQAQFRALYTLFRFDWVPGETPGKRMRPSVAAWRPSDPTPAAAAGLDDLLAAPKDRLPAILA